MADLSQFFPQQTETVNRIYAWHKKRGDSEPQRGYLGASIIGHECERYLWYVFRGVVREEIEGRIYRLFETGDIAEGRFVAELRGIGCEVHDHDRATSEQIEINAFGGHFSGHMDAAVLGVPEAPKTWHVGEFKTHNDKSFQKLLKEGVRASKPLHFAQMQAYMGGTGMKRALYLASNKDTDELYSERVKFEPAFYDNLMDKAGRVIHTSKPPLRVANRQDDFRCRFCDAYTLCWGVDRDGIEPQEAVPVPAVTCRTCCHSDADTEVGGWRCEHYGGEPVDPAVGADCPSHLTLPGLMEPWAEPADADHNWIEFKNLDGSVWRHGNGVDEFASHDLIQASRNPRRLPIASLAVDFDDLPLIDRYPWGDSERVWDGPTSDLPSALERALGRTAEELNETEPKDTQNDEQVNAAEYWLNSGHYLVVAYKKDRKAAIWRGKE